MLKVLRSICSGIIYILINEKLFVALLFLLSAGNEFELSDSVKIPLELLMVFAVTLNWLRR